MHKPQCVVILDFGAQYTQLIARRVREFGVFSVVLPYTATLDEIQEKEPERHHSVGRPGKRAGRGCAQVRRGAVFAGRSGAWHLLRHAADRVPAGRQGGGLRPARIRAHRPL